MSTKNLWNLIPSKTKGFLETSIASGRICEIPEGDDVYQTLKAMVTYIADVVNHDYHEQTDELLEGAVCTMSEWKYQPKYIGFYKSMGFPIIHIFVKHPLEEGEEEYADVLPESIMDFNERVGYYLCYELNLDDRSGCLSEWGEMPLHKTSAGVAYA